VTDFQLRLGEREDCSAIGEIYNHAVQHTTATYEYEPLSREKMTEWFDALMKGGYPVFVVCAPGGGVAGWGALHAYRERAGFRFTTEDSIYVAEPYRGQGAGAMLLQALLNAAELRSVRSIIAAVDSDNAASLRLHAKFGFEKVGHFKQIGFKFGRWLDVIYMEKLIQPFF
jgi:phosphinothricin acetyltransferase